MLFIHERNTIKTMMTAYIYHLRVIHTIEKGDKREKPFKLLLFSHMKVGVGLSILQTELFLIHPEGRALTSNWLRNIFYECNNNKNAFQ